MFSGSLIGIVVGVVFCGIFAAVAMVIGKKEHAKLSDILAGVSDQDKNLIKNQVFEATDGKDMFITNAYVCSAEKVGDKIEAVLLFYAEEHQSFMNRKAKVKSGDAVAAKLVKGAFVPALMKYDREMHYHDFKKLL